VVAYFLRWAFDLSSWIVDDEVDGRIDVERGERRKRRVLLQRMVEWQDLATTGWPGPGLGWGRQRQR